MRLGVQKSSSPRAAGSSHVESVLMSNAPARCSLHGPVAARERARRRAARGAAVRAARRLAATRQARCPGLPCMARESASGYE
eukprot:6202331-Pleurochrysis_carterae.AAC.1